MASLLQIAEEQALPRVFGRYLLIQRLSSGGMGEIFLAKHGLAGFEKLCVIKKVLPHLNEDEHFLSRFVDEAQVAIHLQHANIAQVFEVGRVGEEYFLSLEYVEGRDLRRCLSVLDERGQRFPLDLALLICRDVANGLAYAHRRTGPRGESLELVHCDISPPNVVISFEGEIKVIDFGIAKSAVRVTATDPRMGFGKFGYMAPEQLMRGGKIDHRTDIYAVGSVMYEVLTGERLYTMGESPDYRELAKQVVNGEHARLSELDPELAPFDGIVERALAPMAGDRYQSAAELRDAIQHALVRINPTLATDTLGSFMRELFAEDMREIQRLTALARDADLAAWQAQLADQTSSTVSFALLPGESTTQAPKKPAPASTWQGPATISSSITDLVDPPLRPRRRGAFLVIALIVLLGAGGALAMLASRTDLLGADPQAASLGGAGQDEPAPDSKRAASARDDQVADEPPTPIVDALTESDLQGTGVDLEDEMDSATGQGVTAKSEPGRKTARPSSRTNKRPRSTLSTPPEKTEPDPPPVPVEAAPKELTRAEIEAKFRAVNAEYQDFQKSYGARLDDRWSDLVHAIQYAQSADKLRELSRKLDGFRAAMRKVQASGSL
jgi:eukaryotic-like serine/threonine-protein kinase